MRLYYLNNSKASYDDSIGIVVLAHSEQEARWLASVEAVCASYGDTTLQDWLDASVTSCHSEETTEPARVIWNDVLDG